MTTQEKKYLAAQKAFVELTGLKVGSKVAVVSKAKDYQFGWSCHWESFYMDDLVGNGVAYEVEGIDDDGIYIEGYYYPFFCLEVVDTTSIRLSDDYDAVINDDGSVTVGCQHINFLTLKTIYDEAASKLPKKAPAKKVPAKKAARKR